MLTEYLAFQGCSVSAAEDGKEAIAVARRVKPQIILMDLRLPKVDGFDVSRQLRGDPAMKGTTIIAVTTRAVPQETDQALAAGCDAMISKPFDLAELGAALTRVATKGVAALDVPGVNLVAASPTYKSDSSRNASRTDRKGHS